MKWIKCIGAIIATITLVVILNSRMGVVPALGPFLNPVDGFWQSAGAQHDPGSEWLTFPELRDSVLVVIDDRRVPHIFARNNHDVYLAQGFVTARDRLWQMDLQTRSAAGTLSEILGKQTLQLDKTARRRGMMFGAENKLRMYEQDPELMEILNAYTTGVNIWIDALSDRNIPLEYKLLGHKPDHWVPVNTLLMHMNMATTLAGGSSAVSMSEMRQVLGETFLDRFLPAYPANMDPIIPPGTPFTQNPLQPADVPSFFSPSVIAQDLYTHPDPALGSNSWAVDGSRTVTGRPLLANDMHLEMTLPAIWYEVQLHTPDQNVYGVSIPGIPSVIVGFNKDIAWGFTNSGANVLDIYEIKFRDASFREYYHDGEWKPVDIKVEEIPVRGQGIVRDTVVYTHHGPVRFEFRDALRGQASQWLAHRGSTDIQTFLKLNRARSYTEFVEAIQYFESPAQNFTYADRDGNISIWNNGLYPLRWQGMGDFISDGSDPAYDWNEFVPRDHVPHITNPERGFVSSANQNPTDETYPYYLGRFFSSYERGARINEVLAGSDQFDYSDMMALQLDNISLTARSHTGNLLQIIEAHDQFSSLPDSHHELLAILRNWDYEMYADAVEPVLFTEWANQFRNKLWSIIFNGRVENRKTPDMARTLDILSDTDDFNYLMTAFGPATPPTLEQLVFDAWNDSLIRLSQSLGSSTENWAWWRYQRVGIMHLSRVEPLSRLGIRTSGATEAVNSVRGAIGPSWRMVVSLEDEVKAWGVYPGGQSGNPGNRHYDDFIEPWARGQFFPLHFFPDDAAALHWLQQITKTEMERVQP